MRSTSPFSSAADRASSSGMLRKTTSSQADWNGPQ